MKGIQQVNKIGGLGSLVPISTIDLIAKRKRDVITPIIPSVILLSAGLSHSLAIIDGIAYGWGDGANYVFGDGTTTDRHTPSIIGVGTAMEGKTVVAICAGKDCSFFVCSDGTIYSAGTNISGRLGNGTSSTPNMVLTQVAVDTSLAGKIVVGINTSWDSVLCWCDDGTLHGWGEGGQYVLGNGTTTDKTKPVAVAVDTSLAGKTIINASVGRYNGHCVCDDGTLHGWGYGPLGNVGDGGLTTRQKPVTISGGSLAGKTLIGVIEDAASHTSHALASDGTLHGWGNNLFNTYYGMIGDGSNTKKSSPVLVRSDVATMDTFNTLMHIVTISGIPLAWGDGTNGCAGQDPVVGNTSSPLAVAVDTSLAGKTIIKSFAGGSNALFLCDDGTIHGCGLNNSGQIGDGTTTQRFQPVETDLSGV